MQKKKKKNAVKKIQPLPVTSVFVFVGKIMRSPLNATSPRGVATGSDVSLALGRLQRTYTPADPSVAVSLLLTVAAATGGHFQLRASKAFHERVGPLLVLQQTLVCPFPQSHHQVHQSNTHTHTHTHTPQYTQYFSVLYCGGFISQNHV